MTLPTTSNQTVSPAIEALLEQLAALRDGPQPSGNQGIVHKVRIGACLNTIRGELKKEGPGWQKRLARLSGYSESEAERLMLLATRWGAWIADPGADEILDALAENTLTLAVLSRLPFDELRRLIEEEGGDLNFSEEDARKLVGDRLALPMLREAFERFTARCESILKPLDAARRRLALDTLRQRKEELLGRWERYLASLSRDQSPAADADEEHDNGEGGTVEEDTDAGAAAGDETEE